MQPWQFPSGQWVDLDAIQTVSTISETLVKLSPKSKQLVSRRFFQIGLALNPTPLILEIYSHHDGKILEEHVWNSIAGQLQNEHTALLNAWRGQDNVELVFDSNSVRAASHTDGEATYMLDLKLEVAKDSTGTQLLEYIMALPQLQPAAETPTP